MMSIFLFYFLLVFYTGQLQNGPVTFFFSFYPKKVAHYMHRTGTILRSMNNYIYTYSMIKRQQNHEAFLLHKLVMFCQNQLSL